MEFDENENHDAKVESHIEFQDREWYRLHSLHPQKDPASA